MYVAPVNVEHMASQNAYDTQGMARTLSRIAEVAKRQKAEFIDLHDLLPDTAFADFADHLFQGAGAVGSRDVARRIADPLMVRAVPPAALNAELGAAGQTGVANGD